MKMFLMMALVLVVSMVVFPAGIQAQGYSPNARKAEIEARNRDWQRMREYQQRVQEYQQRIRGQQTRQSQQRERRMAMMSQDYQRCHCINPYTLFEGGGGGRGYGGGPTGSAPRYSAPPRSDYGYRTRYEIDMRKQQFEPILRGGPYGAGNQLREKANQAEKDRADRNRDMDRMASRATQSTQPSRVSDRMGLAPKIEKKDLEGPFKGYLDSKALDRNVGGSGSQRERSSGQSSPSPRESPQRESRSWRDDVREKNDHRN